MPKIFPILLLLFATLGLPVVAHADCDSDAARIMHNRAFNMFLDIGWTIDQETNLTNQLAMERVLEMNFAGFTAFQKAGCPVEVKLTETGIRIQMKEQTQMITYVDQQKSAEHLLAIIAAKTGNGDGVLDEKELKHLSTMSAPRLLLERAGW